MRSAASRVDWAERMIARDDWSGARRLLKSVLRAEPWSHWLHTRIGLTYYEEHEYGEALKWERKALKLAPWCPLVLWDYAGTLDMLGRRREAAGIYRRLIRRGPEAIATGRCGEGLRRGRGLVADSYYRVAWIHADAGRRSQALKAITRHLELRGPGCGSIYPISTAQRLKRRLQARARKL